MAEPIHDWNRDWNKHYATGETPWDSGVPSRELERVLSERQISPCRVLEFGCGTGTNALFLAGRDFGVTAVDIAGLAIERARAKAQQAGLSVQFLEADVLKLPDLGPPFPFVFDRGAYHILRNVDLDEFCKVLSRVTQPGSFYLVLAGNANESNPREGGPPRVHAHEMCLELGTLLELVQLREFRFDGVKLSGKDFTPLAWSGLWRRK